MFFTSDLAALTSFFASLMAISFPSIWLTRGNVLLFKARNAHVYWGSLTSVGFPHQNLTEQTMFSLEAARNHHYRSRSTERNAMEQHAKLYAVPFTTRDAASLNGTQRHRTACILFGAGPHAFETWTLFGKYSSYKI